MEVDTGAAVSLVSHKTYQKVVCVNTFGEVYNQAQYFHCRVYSSGRQITVDVHYGREGGARQLYIVKGSERSLLGRDWLQNIRLGWGSIKTLTTYNSQLTLRRVVQKYREVFQPGLDTLHKFKAHRK